MKKYLFFLILFSLVVAGFGCPRRGSQDGSKEIDRKEILSNARDNGLIMDDSEIAAMADPAHLQSVLGENPDDVSGYLVQETQGWKGAALADVTGGGSFGLAFATFDNETFTFIAKMGNLPELSEGNDYTGWLVRRGKEMRVVNIGKVKKVGEQSVSVFLSKIDLSDFDFFVLTRELDDQNPAPGDHILEGTLK